MCLSLAALPHYIMCPYISLSLLPCAIHLAAETERMEDNFHLSLPMEFSIDMNW